MDIFVSAVDFFINDTIKIFLLLIAIVFVVSIIRSFLPPEKIKKILSHKNKFVGNILASLLGIITPFCSCSAIPLFLGFIEAGVPLGVTFSFLVASPMINEIALALLFSLFGWKVASVYVVSGLIIAILSGIIIGELKVENLVEDFSKGRRNNPLELSVLSWRQRFAYAKNYTFDIVKRIWLFIVIGVGIGAFIHGYVPAELIARYAGGSTWYAVPLAVLIGIPLYSNAAGVMPLVSVLTEKGVSMGASLAFMMSVTGLSLPEFLILKKVMKTKLIIIFAGVVGVGILFTGYLFNLVLR
ncbi:MAG: permease [Candidatus Staskawiczbacteria bacterium]|nr:permease [Candidatus Staskawiczbacteria bacterium]